MTAAEKPPTPELDKMLEVQDQSRLLSEFIDWLASEKDIYLLDSPNRLFGEFFGIDVDAAEREREALLAFIREET